MSAPLAVASLLVALMAACAPAEAQLNGAEGAGELFKALNNLGRCREATGTTEDEVRRMIETHRVPTSRNGQCLIACMAETYGVMREGRFSADAAMQLADNMLQKIGQMSGSLRGEIQHVIKTCSSAGTPDMDACETAASVANCGVEESRKMRTMRGHERSSISRFG
ncbi:uncharacterized protein LOC117646797 [Thrips palmi]|uniref:Uncharacterized protein LOC117646797 n=1 Tax=Thrips palmi TaxID=161013 RepID=A0A6P8Z9Z4_THRPL|nr:uncharacterized protein LOC117646797 [Thrips palmi]